MGSVANPKGYRYRDADLDHPLTDPQGILKILVKAGDADKAKAIVIGKGYDLPVPGGQAAPEYLDQEPDVTVRLIKSDGGVCWESTFSEPAIKNQDSPYGLFKDKCGVGSHPACP